ncbi:MAG: cation diffusion facilitator family transporter [Clostridia bacterium]|nr:cation diffusion facilitator family transporter [Clostridia bacterium]
MTNLLIRLFIKSKDTKSKEVREKTGSLGSIVGILCNILLCVIKISIGLITASISIVADGLNNLSDMGSSVITMIGFKLSGKPADSDHPFGHGRIEYISAFVVSMLILLVGIELIISSIKALIAGEKAPQYTYISLAVLVISILVKLWMFLFNRKLGKMIESSALLATASDSLNDCISTGAILIAAIVTMIFTIPFNLDAVMAIGVGLFIIYSGITSAKDTLDEILGGPPEPQLIKDIEKAVMAFDGFLGVHDLIVHNYGPGRQFASVHVEVPQDVDIVACHEKIDLCEKVVCEKTGVSLVIHMDPIDVNDSSVTDAKEKMIKVIKDIDQRLTLHDFRMTPHSTLRTNLIFDVVMPSGMKMSETELNEIILKKAKEIDESYCCVITFDRDFTGK